MQKNKKPLEFLIGLPAWSSNVMIFSSLALSETTNRGPVE